jgi:hypothetical protein
MKDLRLMIDPKNEFMSSFQDLKFSIGHYFYHNVIPSGLVSDSSRSLSRQSLPKADKAGRHSIVIR